MAADMGRPEGFLRALVTGIGRLVGWLLIVLMGVTIFDVITRRFFVLGSTQLQELEWHIHTVIFALALGYAYLRNDHVRIELVYGRLRRRSRLWIEIAGICLFLMPFTGVTLYYGTQFAYSAFLSGEASPSPVGLPHRWVIKSVLPLGLLVLLLAAVAVLLRCVDGLRRTPNGADDADDAGAG